MEELWKRYTSSTKRKEKRKRKKMYQLKAIRRY
jgi:hypothetical protein